MASLRVTAADALLVTSTSVVVDGNMKAWMNESTDCIDAANHSCTKLTSPKIVFIEQQASDILVKYIWPVIILVGTVGNVLSFLVLVRSRAARSPSSVHFYLMMLACADTTVLYTSGFKTWVRACTGFELLHVSDVSCKLVTFIMLVAFHLAAWLLVLITLDRFIAVWFPLRATTMCTLTRAVCAASILTAVILLYSTHVFWTQSLLGEDGRCRMRIREPFNLIITMTKLVTYSLLPFLIILVLNVAIIVRLRWTAPALRGQLVRHVTRGPSSTTTSVDGMAMTSLTYYSSVHQSSVTATVQQTSVQTQDRVTYMLLTVSFAWLLLTGPFGLFSLIVQSVPASAHGRAIHTLAKTVVFTLYYINHSINFFLYCLTGNKFRRQLVELLCCACRMRRRGPAYSPSVKTLRSNCAPAEAVELQDQLLQQQPSLRSSRRAQQLQKVQQRQQAVRNS